MNRLIQIPIFAGFSNLALAVILHAGPGDLDTRFAGTGTTRLSFGFGEDLAYAVAVQPDGKLVVAGSSGLIGRLGGNFSVVRYDTHDALDPSFGEGGKVITPILGIDNYAQAHAVNIQEDGKIVLAGTANNGTNTIFAMVRYWPNGSLDSSFGEGGITLTDFGEIAEGNAMVIQPDGKIIMAGSVYDGASGGFALARYTTNGAPDLTFGGSGKVVTDVNPNTRAYGMTLQADGKVIVAGGIIDNFAVFRYTTNGVLDTAFGADGTGKVLTHIGDRDAFSTAYGVAIQTGNGTSQDPDKIVVVGDTEATPSHYVFAVVRYGLDGLPDGSFGSGGVATSPVGPGDGFGDFPTSVLIQGTGLQSRRIVVAGYTRFGSSDIFCLARFNPNGTLDPSFDGDGKVLTSFGPDDNQARAIAFVPGGKLVVVGSNITGPGNTDFALARYNLSDGSPDVTFDNDGMRLQDVATRSASARGVAVQRDGKVVVAGSCDNGAGSSFVLARFNAEGGLDTSFGNAGKVIVPLGEVASGANAVLIQQDGAIVAAGYSAADFAVVRFHPDGAPDLSFGAEGVARTPFGTNGAVASAMALQSDNKIVVAGTISATGDFAVARYGTNGTPDGTFDGDGTVTTAIEVGNDAASAVSIQSDGKIVVAGYGLVGADLDFVAVRYNTNGAIDNSFGTFGRVATGIGAGAAAFAVAIQPDSKILLAGYTSSGTSIDLGLVRYTTNGVPDDSFDGDGIVTTSIGLGTDVGTAMALQTDGKIIVAGAATIGDRTEFAAVRYLANGVIDNSYGAAGKAIINFPDADNNSGAALALDSSGRAVIVGDAGGLFGVARLQGDADLRILSLTHPADGHTVLSGVGVPNQSHTIQSSTNLVSGSFSTLGQTTADATGVWQYEDTESAGFPRRFYRLVTP